jgi:hypothetical protein
VSYVVTGIIIDRDGAKHIWAKHQGLRAVPLELGLALFPLTKGVIETLLPPPRSRTVDRFEHLHVELLELLAGFSALSPVLYFETEYFGGEGTQSAIVVDNGKIVFGPKQAGIGPISEGLRLLGVKKRSSDFDEFAAVGLQRHRWSEDWLKA